VARGVLLHHDNARPHTARATQGRIQALQWELPEHPSYSPDLTPSDFHLFGLLEKHLGGRSFADDEDVEMEVGKWLKKQSKDFCVAGFDALLKRRDKCINVGGEYVEKLMFSPGSSIIYFTFFIYLCPIYGLSLVSQHF
jgi:histone-lysine N-methyltransferase SETMAR